jgi:hypothetical protein
MSNRELLFEEMTKAIQSYRLRQLSLSGLVNRLEELAGALSDVGIAWCSDLDDFLLQLEIINSLVLSGDKPELTLDDVTDIEKYLELIQLEITSQVCGGADGGGGS